MAGGYVGKVLFVDLSDGTLEEQELPGDLVRNFVGGYGIGARVLYDRMKPGVDPLGAENVLGFVTGPLTGSGAFFGSRYALVCKSPVTGGWNDANSGGFFGAELKKAGYDAVFVSGAAREPVYLWIENGRAGIRSAAGLWGKDTEETFAALVEETGQPKLRAAVIGPAGEKQSLMACVINEGHRAAGRGGGGAVMGSKKLKAVAVHGTGEVPVADPARLKEINREITASMKNGPGASQVAAFSEWGTGAGASASALNGDSPVKNWGGTGVVDFGEEAAQKVGAPVLDRAYKVRKYACSACPLACGAEYRVDAGRWPLGRSGRPEYETLAAFGSLCLNSDAGAILKCNDICNRAGLDTISTGATVAWAMECYENGVLTKEDLDGIELTWGNGEAMVALTEKIAEQAGCGGVLALGSAAAAAKWGKGAEYLMTVGGIELPMHDPRFAPGFARTYRFDPTPARHVKGGLGLVQMADPSPAKYNYQGTGPADMLATYANEVLNAAGLCVFMGIGSPPEAAGELIEAVTGRRFSPEDQATTGLRILNMRHSFNLREGLKPVEFAVPTRVVGKPPQKQGPVADVTVDDRLLGQNFFSSVGWDWDTGKPASATLQRLGGMDDVIVDLYG